MECVLIFIGFMLAASAGAGICISLESFRNGDWMMGIGSVGFTLLTVFLTVICFKGVSDGPVYEFPADEYRVEIKTVSVGERVDSSYVVFKK